MSDFRERDKLNNLIFDTVEDYLDNKDIYSIPAYLAINPKTFEIYIASSQSEQIKGIDYYPISDFIRISEEGQEEADCDATYDLSSSYIFIE